MLPNKMIYVSKADLSTFERAQELSGNNLSSTIAQTLRRYVEVEESKQDGFDEITVKLGEKGTYRSKRFMGKELARTQFVVDEEEDDWVTVFIVYVTANNRFALYTKEIYNWSFAELKQKEMA
ncbi:MAG TPA: EXLDI protein, partial [Bacillales bacterium]|nr:EXLDI protein [Bacillales bacterium]